MEGFMDSSKWEYYAILDENYYIVGCVVATTQAEIDDVVNHPDYIRITEDQYKIVGPGTKLIEGEIVQAEVPVIKPTRGENAAIKQRLLGIASQQVSILNDAVEMDMATEEEVRLLPLWKKYRVLLNRVNTDIDDFIKWPEEPK